MLIHTHTLKSQQLYTIPPVPMEKTVIPASSQYVLGGTPLFRIPTSRPEPLHMMNGLRKDLTRLLKLEMDALAELAGIPEPSSIHRGDLLNILQEVVVFE